MKILVIFTGGTIGSTENDGWIMPDSKTNYTLINHYVAKFGSEVSFDTFTPFTLLSENLSAAPLTALVQCVNDNIARDYDGIIVTHGTDTLQFSAAALSFTANAKNIPVVLVSSNYPLGDARSNGFINFEAAVAFVQAKAGTGVYVSYKNTNSDAVNIHHGARLLAHSETMDDVYSLDDAPYASYADGKILLNKHFQPVASAASCGDVSFCENPQILVVNSHPADAFEYNLAQCKAVMLLPYHSGTLNTQSKAFQNFCLTAKEKNVPIFVVNFRSGVSYESTKIYDELGLTLLPLSSFAPIYTKLWIAASIGADMKEFVLRPITGEFLE